MLFNGESKFPIEGLKFELRRILPTGKAKKVPAKIMMARGLNHMYALSDVEEVCELELSEVHQQDARKNSIWSHFFPHKVQVPTTKKKNKSK